MTALIILQSIIIWVIIGVWICYKRDWYKHEIFEREWLITFTIIFMPIAFIMALVREFITREWNYHK